MNKLKDQICGHLAFSPCMSCAELHIKAVLTRNHAVCLNINTAVITVLM